jgi:hypothetical protein
MIDDSVGIHRTVSSHVLRYIPVTPRRPETSKWPLGFMTERCRDSNFTGNESEDFGSEELSVSGKILQWERQLDEQVKGAIAKEIWKEEKVNGESSYFYPPMVIRAKSGFGKSVLIGKLMAELIDAKYSGNSKEWPIYDRIVYSQLKDQTGSNLEYAICNGMDGYHKCNNLDTFFENTELVPRGDKIIMIDSLDENPGRQEWWNISLRLSEHGWRVIWTCRNPDWDAYKLGENINNYYGAQDEEKLWDWFSGKDWKLRLDTKRKSQLDSEIESISGLSNVDLVHKFVWYCYSETQLMHIYHTNFDLEENYRDKLDRQLIQNLLLEREKIITDEKDAEMRNFDDREWYYRFFNINLARVIIDTSLKFYSKDEDNKYDVFEQWDIICKEYFESNDNRKQGQLNESVVSESLDIDDLLNFLKLSGIMRKTEDGMKFRHRDFAVIAYVRGSPNGLNGLFESGVNFQLKDDILFKHFFPTEVLDTNNQTEIVEDFLRRTGNIVSQLNVLSDMKVVPKEINYIAKTSLNKMRLVEYESSQSRPDLGHDKGLSKSQVQSLTLGNGERAIVLHGVPGSGKTFSGVERILIRQAALHKEGRSDSYALIVSLTNELANSISQELERHHLDSPFLADIEESKRPDVIKTIEVKSLKTLLEEWMIFQISMKDSTVEYLRPFFNPIRKSLKLKERDFRLLLEDYQQNMFDEISGKFLDLDEYLKSSPPEGKLNKEVRTQWHQSLQPNSIQQRPWNPSGHNWLIDDDHLRWSLFEKLKGRMNDVQERDYRKFQADYQQNMFDESSGNFLDLDEYLDKNPFGLDKNVREEWHTLVQDDRKKGMLPLNEACALVRNRLLKFESDSYQKGQWNENYKVANEHYKFDEERNFDLFSQKFQSGFYDCIMVDEVQDLPAIAVNMLSFMSPYRDSAPDRFILSGDKFQTLNGQKFEWEKFLRRLTYMTGKITQDHIHINSVDGNNALPTTHHLLGLYWKAGDIDSVIENQLSENHRNDPSINALTMFSWKNWPSKDYYDEVNTTHPMEMVSRKERMTSVNEQFTPIMVIQSSDGNDYVSKIELILKTITKRSGVSLLCTNEKLRDFVIAKMDDDKNEESLKVETFDPWTIKGLERNGVVILGAYTSSRHDVDSEILWSVNFDRNTEYNDFEQAEQEAINLMRRKMLVSNTRAVEQLIMLESPRNEVFHLDNNEEFMMKSLPSPDYTDVETEPAVVVLQHDEDLEDQLKDFFKGSVIKEVHISIKRISEGLKLQARTSTLDGKKEYERFKSSLAGILENDPPESELRKLLKDTFRHTKNIDLNKHSVISDIMKLEENERSYFNKSGDDSVVKNEYSIMVKKALSLEQSDSGPWSLKGFENLHGVVSRFNTLKENLKEGKRSFNMNYKTNPNMRDLLDDIDRVTTSIADLFTDFSLHMGLPSNLEDKKDLVLFLFSGENRIKNSTYTEIKDASFAISILDNIKSNIKIDSKGIYNTTLSDKTVLQLNWDYIDQFLNDLISIDFDTLDGNKSVLSRFAQEMVDAHTDFQQQVQLNSIDELSINRVKKGYSFSIQFLVKHGTEDTINLSTNKNAIIDFISKQFPGMMERQIESFLENLIQRNMSLMSRVEDDVVLTWDLSKFMIFTDKLRSQIHSAFKQRADRLYGKSEFISRITMKAISIDRNLREIGDELMKMMEKENARKSYETLLSHMNQHVIQSFRVAKEGNHHHSTLPYNVPNYWNEIITLNQILKLGNYTFGNEAHRKLIGEFVDPEFLDDRVHRIKDEVVEMLELFENNHKFMSMNHGKRFIVALLKLQAIVSNYEVKKLKSDDVIERFPILQLLGVFELQQASSLPQAFAPRFLTDKDEQNWRKANENRYVYPCQKDALEHLVLTESVFDSWETNMTLHKLISDTTKSDISQRVGWKFDGFGLLVDFDAWVEENNEFFKLLSGHSTEDTNDGVFLLSKFDLKSRVKIYLKIVNASLGYLSQSGSSTIGIKTLMQNIIPSLFTNQIQSLPSTRKRGSSKLKLSLKPNGTPLQVEYDKESKKINILPATWEGSEFYSLLKQFMPVSGKHTFDKNSAKEDLNYFKDLFMEYLNREQSEFADTLDENLKLGNWDIDKSSLRQLKGLHGSNESEKVEESISSPETAEEPSVEDDSSFTDSDVMIYFKIPEFTWNTIGKEGRQRLRDDYSNKR